MLHLTFHTMYFYFMKSALKWHLTLHGHALSSCLGYVLNAASIFSTLRMTSVHLMDFI